MREYTLLLFLSVVAICSDGQVGTCTDLDNISFRGEDFTFENLYNRISDIREGENEHVILNDYILINAAEGQISDSKYLSIEYYLDCGPNNKYAVAICRDSIMSDVEAYILTLNESDRTQTALFIADVKCNRNIQVRFFMMGNKIYVMRRTSGNHIEVSIYKLINGNIKQ